MIGKTLSHYRITAALGAGGMGEVYRATDTKLNREVAIKVLPSEVARDPERLARFQREAQLLAALNHPNIAAIHGLEEVEGTPFLALELVEGEDLKERLERGAIPLEEAVGVATQIAQALEAAHARGIVHRDLKPANVKLTPEGQVKVLDFGLAKAWEGEAMSGSSPDLSQSPTLAHAGTAAGLILGTAAYMSPEQARGKPVDSRSDIWAFGVLLFEMLTGRQLFQGETVSDVLAAVLTREPDWTTLPAATPPSVRRTLKRCLVRQPADRLHHVADARLELQAPETEIETERPMDAGSRGPGWRTVAAGSLVSALVAVGATLWVGGPSAPEASASRLARFEVRPPSELSLTTGLALSPDGRSLAFTARGESGRPSLWVRTFDSLEPRLLEGTEGARLPFWSPDGRRVGFFAGHELLAVDLIGGSQQVLAATAGDLMVRGASWGADDTIVYAPTFAGGLMRVSATGEHPPEAATRLEAGDGTHRFPTFLPDGRRFLFYASGGSGVEPGDICIGELGSLEVRRLARADSTPAFLEPQFLLFALGEALVAQEIDLDRLELRGDPHPLGVTFPGSIATSGYRPLTAASGVVAYRVPKSSGTRVVWVDRTGREIGVVAEPDIWHAAPRVSPDGRRITLSMNDDGDTDGDVWVVDPGNDNRTRLTYDQRDDWAAAWSADGRRLAFCSIGAASPGLYLADPDRPGEHRPLWQPEAVLNPAPTWLPNGREILVDVYGEDNQLDVWRVPVTGDGEPRPFLATSFAEHDADVSPDGRWVAFVSNTSGRDEVYVRPMEDEGGTRMVSTDGGVYPVWRRDGRELFYVDASGRMMAVATTLTPSLTKGSPEVLFQSELQGVPTRQYDVAPDGQRFLLVQAVSTDDPVVVVLGWANEIESSR